MLSVARCTQTSQYHSNPKEQHWTSINSPRACNCMLPGVPTTTAQYSSVQTDQFYETAVKQPQAGWTPYQFVDGWLLSRDWTFTTVVSHSMIVVGPTGNPNSCFKLQTCYWCTAIHCYVESNINITLMNFSVPYKRPAYSLCHIKSSLQDPVCSVRFGARSESREGSGH